MFRLSFIFKTFIIWRILLFLPLLLGEKFLQYRPGYEYTQIFYFIKKIPVLSNILFYPWANFDGVHYLTIAAQGYTDNVRFLPFYPLLTSIIATIFGVKNLGIGLFVIAFEVANISFVFSLIVLFRLLKLDYKENIIKETLLFLVVFPTSFFFVSIYSESLFLLLVLLSFYLARKKRWVLASICGMLATATRPVGIAILPALIIEFLSQNKSTWTISWKKALPLLLVPLGIAGYSLYNLYKWGNAVYFLQAHAELANGRSSNAIVLIPQTLYRYFKILTSVSFAQYEWKIALLEVTVFFFAGFFLYLAWRQKIRVSYLVFSILAFLIPTSTGTFTGLPRYVIVLFPVFLSLALIKNRLAKVFYFVVSVILLFILTMLFSKGYYVS